MPPFVHFSWGFFLWPFLSILSKATGATTPGTGTAAGASTPGTATAAGADRACQNLLAGNFTTLFSYFVLSPFLLPPPPLYI